MLRWFVISVMLISGGTMLNFAYGLQERARQIMQSYPSATAQVIALRAESFDSGDATGIAYRPQVEFTTHDGQTIRAMMLSASTPAALRVGDRTLIYYNPLKPSDIFAPNQDRFGYLLIMSVGWIFAALGGLVLVAPTLLERVIIPLVNLRRRAG